MPSRSLVAGGLSAYVPLTRDLRRDSLHSPLRYERRLVGGEGLEPPTLSVQCIGVKL